MDDNTNYPAGHMSAINHHRVEHHCSGYYDDDNNLLGDNTVSPSLSFFLVTFPMLTSFPVTPVPFHVFSLAYSYAYQLCMYRRVETEQAGGANWTIPTNYLPTDVLKSIISFALCLQSFFYYVLLLVFFPPVLACSTVVLVLLKSKCVIY